LKDFFSLFPLQIKKKTRGSRARRRLSQAIRTEPKKNYLSFSLDKKRRKRNESEKMEINLLLVLSLSLSLSFSLSRDPSLFLSFLSLRNTLFLFLFPLSLSNSLQQHRQRLLHEPLERLQPLRAHRPVDDPVVARQRRRQHRRGLEAGSSVFVRIAARLARH